jgi:hypothetical protein
MVFMEESGGIAWLQAASCQMKGMGINMEEGRCPLCIGAEDVTQSIG